MGGCVPEECELKKRHSATISFWRLQRLRRGLIFYLFFSRLMSDGIRA